jgi:hypothetical protein
MMASPLRISIPLLRDLLPVTDCRIVNCFVAETGVAGFAGLVACSPNAEVRKKTIAKKVSFDSNEDCFIVTVDFLAPRIN